MLIDYSRTPVDDSKYYVHFSSTGTGGRTSLGVEGSGFGAPFAIGACEGFGVVRAWVCRD